jgi:maleate isomerase
VCGAGVEVAGLLHFDLGPEFSGVHQHLIFDRGGRWRVLPDDVRHQVRAGFPAGADGVLIPGSGIRSAEAVEPLRRDLGVPVITANQSCMWYLLGTELRGSTTCTSSANSTPS